MTQGAETCCKLQNNTVLHKFVVLSKGMLNWLIWGGGGGCLAGHPKKGKRLCEKSSSVRPSSPGDRRLHITALSRYLASPAPPTWRNSSTPDVLISNSVRPVHMKRMEFCILASGEQHRIVRAAVRPIWLHIWTMVWSYHARLVNYTSMSSSKLLLRPSPEMNREWCNCQLTLEATSYTRNVEGLLRHPV